MAGMDSNKTLVCDVETNGLFNYTQLWCAVTYCIETKELKVFKWRPDNGHIKEFSEYIQDVTHWIGHNFIGFDRGAIRYFCDVGGPISLSRITDTLVRSRLFNSGRDGGHALERWGAYFGIPKVGKDIEDWSYFQPIMVERCKRDVLINLKLWQFQQKEGANVSTVAVNIEEEFAEIAGEIKEAGFPIDTVILDQKYSRMAARKGELEAEIRAAFPPRPIKIAEVNPKKTKAGHFAKNTKGFKTFKDPSLVWGPFTLIEWQEFNIGSSKQVVERMEEYGWNPEVFTKGGAPKVCEENIATLPASAPKEAKLIKEFLNLKTRLQLMDSWYEALDKQHYSIHGSILGIGAITHRCAHRDPNTANIPKHDGEYKVRECWGLPRDGDRRLVGCDASGVQMRVLGHLTLGFTKDMTFIKQLLDGDVHMDFTGPIVKGVAPDVIKWSTDEERETVRETKLKRFIYAYILGVGNRKCGSIFGTNSSVGKQIKEQFNDRFPGMSALREYLARCAQRGWYPAPDGRFIPIKSEHFALSVALQGIEAILLKLAMILWRREALKRKLDAWFIAFVHDEVQINSHKDCAEEAGKLMVECIKKAGQMLKLRVPMDGSYDIGYNWLETH